MIRRDEAPVEGHGEVAEGDAADAAGGRHDPARRLVEEGRHTEAAELYSAAVAADPQDVGALLGLGSVLLSLSRYEDAERELRRALRIAPEMGTVRHQLGLTLFRRGVYSTAATELRRVVELDSDNAAAYLLLGEALNQLGDPDAAIEALEHALRLQPRNSRIYYALGISYDRKGVPERAAEMYRHSRELGRG
ncbi:hypothetical protein BH23GEM7_BH23GEM7_17110 [soil metagenome]